MANGTDSLTVPAQ